MTLFICISGNNDDYDYQSHEQEGPHCPRTIEE